jgi:FAD binding domain
MHTLTFPATQPTPFCTLAVVRPLQSWTEWLFVCLAAPGVTEITATETEILNQIKLLIGDNSIPVKLKGTTTWRIKEGYAEGYSRGNVFCIGDAVHQQPPHNGLGSNTCIQDAYNLAWKMSYVLKGHALPSLLSTYSQERQPVGKYILKRATETVKIHMSVFSLLGVFEPDIEKRLRLLDEFNEDSPQGAERRFAFQKAVERLDEERHGLGSEMNQLYQSSGIIVNHEEGFPPAPATETDATLYYHESTYPGSRLPHAWLRFPGALGPRKTLISTHDLAGHGRFTLFTGIGGKEAWQGAAADIGREIGFEIKVFAIGWGQDYEDPFFAWSGKRGVHEKGAVLVRPDRTVAWRSMDLEEGAYRSKLLLAVRTIVGFSPGEVGGQG